MTAGGGRRRAIRVSRPMQLWEKATEPLRPLGAPTHLESGFFALSVGLGEAGGGRKKNHTHTQKPRWCLLPRSSATRAPPALATW